MVALPLPRANGLRPSPHCAQPLRWPKRPRRRLARHTRLPRFPTHLALDLGTNNCRLLVARPAGFGFRVDDAFSRIVRLGEGLAATGGLSEDAIERTLDAIKVCAAKIAYRRIVSGRYVATEACRRAANCERVSQPRARPKSADRDRDHLDRRGSAPGGFRLRPAARSEHPLCDRLRHRRRLDGDRLATPRLRAGPPTLAAADPGIGVAASGRRHPDRPVRRRGVADSLSDDGRRDDASGALRSFEKHPPHSAPRVAPPARCRCWAARGR